VGLHNTKFVMDRLAWYRFPPSTLVFSKLIIPPRVHTHTSFIYLRHDIYLASDNCLSKKNSTGGQYQTSVEDACLLTHLKSQIFVRQSLMSQFSTSTFLSSLAYRYKQNYIYTFKIFFFLLTYNIGSVTGFLCIVLFSNLT